ncbi:hypothetical protein GOV08_01320, partial [Candidatus Woesearchaeota archaeon]|nr:hypothetical protein [Candidatus Woesearchaeota archaeon]
PEDVKSDDIAQDIEKAFYGKTSTKKKSFSKALTFIVIFGVYIYITVNTEHYALKAMIMVFGLVFLVLIFQHIVLPSLKKAGKKGNIQDVLKSKGP